MQLKFSLAAESLGFLTNQDIQAADEKLTRNSVDWGHSGRIESSQRCLGFPSSRLMHVLSTSRNLVESHLVEGLGVLGVKPWRIIIK